MDIVDIEFGNEEFNRITFGPTIAEAGRHRLGYRNYF